LKTGNRLSDLQFAGKRGKRYEALAALGFQALQCAEPGIDLWQTGLIVGSALQQQLVTTLSADEKQRAARFRSADDRRRFVVARGMLRHLLGHYLAIAPRAIEFCYGNQGKPCVEQDADMHFNLAHAGERAAYAVSARSPVGIDIERIARSLDFERVARRFFSPNEFHALLQLPEARRRYAFYRLWTAKEAVVKATGKGLAQSLKNFEIDISDNRVPRLIQACEKGLMKMKLCAPKAGRTYIVTVAVANVDSCY
jgi:4'-phosphopantetheinyl transferase